MKNYQRFEITEDVLKKYSYPALSHIRTGDNCKGFLFVDGDSVVGFVNVEEKENKEKWIQGLEVSKDYRKQGVAHTLLNLAVDTLGAEFLSVQTNNDEAIKLYEAEGFYIFDKTENQYFMRYNEKETYEDASVFHEIEEPEDELFKEACKDVEEARKFVSDVAILAKKYDANYFIVTDGASGTCNNNNPSVEHARNAHKEWKREHDFDPDEDWKKEKESQVSKTTDEAELMRNIILLNRRINDFELKKVAPRELAYYKLEDPIQVEKRKKGIPMEFVRYAYTMLKKIAPELEVKCFLWEAEDSKGEKLWHSFLLFSLLKKWYWFESGLENSRGVLECGDLQGCISYVHYYLIKNLKYRRPLKEEHFYEYDPSDVAYRGQHFSSFLTAVKKQEEIKVDSFKQAKKPNVVFQESVDSVMDPNQHFYFYHLVPKGTNVKKDGLLSPYYMHTHDMDDLCLASVEKYRERLCSVWNVYKGRTPESLTLDEILEGLEKVRGKDGSKQIYFFKFPPYEKLSPYFKELLKEKDIYRIDLNDPNLYKMVSVDWGHYNSNPDNQALDESYYRTITAKDYFANYDKNAELPFSTLQHISLSSNDGRILSVFLTKMPKSVSLQEIIKEDSDETTSGELFLEDVTLEINGEGRMKDTELDIHASTEYSEELLNIFTEDVDTMFTEETDWSRKNRYPVFIITMHSGTLLANAIKEVTKDTYSRVGIAFNSKLRPFYSFGGKTGGGFGFSVQNPTDSFYSKFHARFAIHVAYVDRATIVKMKMKLQEFLEKADKFTYDFLGLFRMWMQKESDKEINRASFVCSSFVASILAAGEPLAKHPSLYRPQELADLQNVTRVNSGSDFYKYDYRITERNLKAVRNHQFNLIALEDGEDIYPTGEELATLIDFNKRLNQFSYGIPDSHGKFIQEWEENPEEFNVHYRYLSPGKFKAVKGGVCWDYVAFQTECLKKLGFNLINFYVELEISAEECPTHTFSVVKFTGSGEPKYAYLESSFKSICGVYLSSNLNDIFQFILNEMCKPYQGRRVNYFINMYDEYRNYGCGCEEFMDFMRSKVTIVRGRYVKRNPRFIHPISKKEQLLMTEDSSETFVLKDLIFERIKAVLDIPAKDREYRKIINEFINRNMEKLITSGPIYLIVFGDLDKKLFYDLFGITGEEIVAAITAITNKINSAKVQKSQFTLLRGNPIFALFYYVIRYYTLKKDQKGINISLSIYALAAYPSMFSKYFPKGVNPRVMQYTIDSLTNKFLIKKSKHIFGALVESCTRSYDFHKKNIINGNDTNCFSFIQRIRNDQNSMMKKITNEYMRNYREGNIAQTRNDNYDPDNPILDDVDNSTTIVHMQVQKVTLPIISNGVDIVYAEAAARMAGISISDCRLYLTKILVPEKLNELEKLIESILFIFIYEDHRNIREIKSAFFLAWAQSLFKKTNSNDLNIKNINDTLGRWAKESGIYERFRGEGTRIYYKKGIFFYIIMCIQKYS